MTTGNEDCDNCSVAKHFGEASFHLNESRKEVAMLQAKLILWQKLLKEQGIDVPLHE